MKKPLHHFNLRHRLKYLMVLAAFIAAAGTVFMVFQPVAFRNFLFMPLREALFMQRELRVVQDFELIRTLEIPDAKTVQIPSIGEQQLRLVADLRVPSGVDQPPAVLLLHGSTPWGRKNGLIQLLSLRFSENGWVTLAPDARGFGDSEDPADPADPRSWSVQDDIHRCIRYLAGLSDAKPRQIYVLGHSRGGGHAVEGALGMQDVRGLVLIGPTRFVNGVDSGYWERLRFAAVRRLDSLVPATVVAERGSRIDIARILRENPLLLEQKPVLLVDGARESERIRHFLSEIAASAGPTAHLYTIPSSGHYCGVYNFFGFNTIFYRADIFDPFFQYLLSYLESVSMKMETAKR